MPFIYSLGDSANVSKNSKGSVYLLRTLDGLLSLSVLFGTYMCDCINRGICARFLDV